MRDGENLTVSWIILNISLYKEVTDILYRIVLNAHKHTLFYGRFWIQMRIIMVNYIKETKFIFLENLQKDNPEIPKKGIFFKG